jgi:hypothetical protein
VSFQFSWALLFLLGPPQRIRLDKISQSLGQHLSTMSMYDPMWFLHQKSYLLGLWSQTTLLVNFQWAKAQPPKCKLAPKICNWSNMKNVGGSPPFESQLAHLRANNNSWADLVAPSSVHIPIASSVVTTKSKRSSAYLGFHFTILGRL